MQNRNLHAPGPQPFGRLQSQKPSADYHGPPVCLSLPDQRAGVGQIPEVHHAVKVFTWEARAGGARSGGQHQRVVGLNAATDGCYLALARIDMGDRLVLVHLNAVFPEPLPGFQFQIGFLNLISQ